MTIVKAVVMQRLHQVSTETECDLLRADPTIGTRLLELQTRINAGALCLQVQLRENDRQHVVLTTAFRDHLQDYVERESYLNDPVFKRITKEKIPFEWSSMKSYGEDCGAPPELLRHRRWLTIPIYNGHMVAALHVAGPVDEDEWRSNVASYIWHGSNAGDDILTKILRIRDHTHKPLQLSAMQIDCLALLAAGSDMNAIVKTTRCSVSTINRHIVSAMERLGARNQPHAVAKAISLGLLPMGN